MKYIVPTALIVVAFFTFAIAGCASKSTETTSPNTPVTDDGSGMNDHGDHAQQDGSGQTAMEKMKVELAKMSPEDAASAEKQHMCPVSGEMLGTMGAPEKIDVNGQQVWICCDGCKEQLLASPDEYLAKLK